MFTKLTKRYFWLIETCVVVMFVVLIVVVQNWYQAKYGLWGGARRYQLLPIFAIAIDTTLSMLLTIGYYTLAIKKERSVPDASLPSAILVFGWFSFIFSVLYAIVGILPIDEFLKLFLIYLSVPGTIFGLLSLTIGAVSYKKRRFISWVIIPGLVALTIFISAFINAGGVPFLCGSDNACTAVNRESSCIPYVNYAFPYFDSKRIGPGFCDFVAPGTPLCGSGRPCIFRKSSPQDNLSRNTLPQIIKYSALFAIPLADDKVLMGASHNVFVGKVVSQIGVRLVDFSPGRTVPLTQFSVEPLSNIKGNLASAITVEQFGGYQNGVFYAGEGDTFGPSNKPGAGYLMQPGSTYLFSTRYESDGVYYLWDFPTASKLISQDSNLSDAQLQTLAASDDRVKELQAAYPNEILVADDVRTGNTRNSYVSTHTPPPAPPPPPSAPTSTTPTPPPPPAPVSSSSTASSTGN